LAGVISENSVKCIAMGKLECWKASMPEKKPLEGWKARKLDSQKLKQGFSSL